MSAPLVSVVTPAFRSEHCIGATIQSVLAQSFTDLEMIVVDDCSPDATVSVVKGYAARDPRVRLLRHERNRGPGVARRSALAVARGRYIAFLDGDDLWLPAKLERHLSFVQLRTAALSYTQYRRIGPTGDVLSDVIDVPEQLDYRALLGNTAITTSTVIVDRARTGPFTMRNVYLDDYACWLELLKRGFVALGCREDLTRYRVLTGSHSRNKLKSAKQVWRIYREVERLSWPFAAMVFGQYAWNAYRKYRR